MPTQLSSMVLPHTHTTHTVMDMPHTLMLHSQLPPMVSINFTSVMPKLMPAQTHTTDMLDTDTDTHTLDTMADMLVMVMAVDTDTESNLFFEQNPVILSEYLTQICTLFSQGCRS